MRLNQCGISSGHITLLFTSDTNCYCFSLSLITSLVVPLGWCYHLFASLLSCLYSMVLLAEAVNFSSDLVILSSFQFQPPFPYLHSFFFFFLFLSLLESWVHFTNAVSLLAVLFSFNLLNQQLSI